MRSLILLLRRGESRRVSIRLATPLLAGLLVASAGCTGAGTTETEFGGPDFAEGAVEVVASTPKAVAVGTDRQLVRWTSRNSSGEPRSFVTGVAVDGLPAGCTISNVELWADVADDLQTGTWPSFPQQTIAPGSQGARSSLRRDIGPGCVGRADLILVVRADGSPATVRRVTLQLN